MKEEERERERNRSKIGNCGTNSQNFEPTQAFDDNETHACPNPLSFLLIVRMAPNPATEP
jgi:hypothetical protein